jgi:CBS domain-containing protein
MAEIGVRDRILVKDIMTSPVITVDKRNSVDKVAQLMKKHKLGCIIVTGNDVKPLGIITESDLVTRVLAKNSKPSKLRAEDIMTSPLITIDPDKTLLEAARRMNKLNIRRIGVMYKGELSGIVSSKDILAYTPELIETIQEKATINMTGVLPEQTPLAGYCDQCGRWSDTLKEIEGRFICEGCRIEFKTEY